MQVQYRLPHTLVTTRRVIITLWEVGKMWLLQIQLIDNTRTNITDCKTDCNVAMCFYLWENNTSPRVRFRILSLLHALIPDRCSHMYNGHHVADSATPCAAQT